MIVTYQNIWVNNGGLVASFEKVTPYLVFEFTNGSYVPTVGTGNNYTARFGTWTRVSASPNRWKWESGAEIPFNNWLPGWGCAFSSQDTTPAARLTTTALNGTCSIIEAGGNFMDIQETDRMFAGCDAITSFCNIPLKDGVIANTAGMFSGCTGVNDASAFSYYLRLNEYGSISNHSGMFSDCGPSTYLAKIPTSWGGTWVPPSYALPSAVQPSSGNKVVWKIEYSNFPSQAVTQHSKFNVFTQSSVSSYAGVSMNRSRLYNKINGFSNATSAAMYFRPCFMQMSSYPTGSSTYSPVWLITTSGYNGTLTPNQANTDMPGTLDYASYGPFDLSYGTYDASYNLYFGFLVTNVDSSTWTGLNDGMAFLYNSNYKSDAGLYYFFDT